MKHLITRPLITIVIVLTALLAIFSLTLVAPTATATVGSDTKSDYERADADLGDFENDTCVGPPRMSLISITSPEDRITADQPGVVGASFRVEPTVPQECTVIGSLQFSVAESGFLFGSVIEGDQPTSNLVTTTFEISSGEIRDIRAEVYTNGAEPGDEVTVVTGYELWYEGDRENAVQESDIQFSIEVEEPNEFDPDDREDDDPPEPPPPPPPICEFIKDNLPLFGIISALCIAVVGFVYRGPIVQVIMGSR